MCNYIFKADVIFFLKLQDQLLHWLTVEDSSPDPAQVVAV